MSYYDSPGSWKKKAPETSRKELERKYTQREAWELMHSQQSKKPGYTSTPLKPPPASFLITYIGGPFNATQEEIQRSVQDLQEFEGKIYRKPGETVYSKDKEPYIQAFDYHLTFIPQDQTPFTDAQCIVAVFV